MFRACLMAEDKRRWCGVQTQVRRRGTILPLSATNCGKLSCGENIYARLRGHRGRPDAADDALPDRGPTNGLRQRGDPPQNFRALLLLL